MRIKEPLVRGRLFMAIGTVTSFALFLLGEHANAWVVAVATIGLLSGTLERMHRDRSR